MSLKKGSQTGGKKNGTLRQNWRQKQNESENKMVVKTK